MHSTRRKSLFSLSTVFASFFGAALIAAAFAYFNYKFSEYKFINFSNWVLYTNKDIFVPKDENYILVFFSSNDQKSLEKLHALKPEAKILAIDFYQQRLTSTKDIIFLRTGTNTLLKIIQRFNIYDVPSLFLIKKQYNNGLYKQDSAIRKLD